MGVEGVNTASPHQPLRALSNLAQITTRNTAIAAPATISPGSLNHINLSTSGQEETI